MYPQYAQRRTEGEIAIWILITVGALLIPTIAIAVWCIRHYCWKTLPARRPQYTFEKPTNHPDLLTTKSTSWIQRFRCFLKRSPPTKFMRGHSAHTKTTNMKQIPALRSYNGPYMEWGNDDRMVSSEKHLPAISSLNTDSMKKQHVHWTNHEMISHGEDLRSIKDRQFTPRKQPYPIGDIFNTTALTESPSSHRRPAVIPTPSSGLSHLIQTAIIPAGSTVTNTNATQLLTPSKQSISNSTNLHSAV